MISIGGKRKKEVGLLRAVIVGIFAYVMIFPLIFFDVFLELYHRVCFLIYKYPYIKRQKYIRLDRGSLKYLNWWDKINCIYCGYANGLIYYACKIISETEKYWCPIKHEKNKNGSSFFDPPHHKDFAEFGDEKELKKLIDDK